MTILEKKSERKKKAIMGMVKNGEYSIPYAMIEAERLNDEGRLLADDYEELMEYLESLLEPTEEPTDEDFGLTEEETPEEVIEENIEESPEEENLEET